MPQQIRPTALVVDDEPLLVELAADFLDELGFNTIAKTCPVEALKWLARAPSLCLLLTDVQMPKMNGLELAAHARRLFLPSLPVIFVSGFTTEFFGGEVDLPGSTLFLKKPYRSSELQQAIANLYRSA